MLRSRHFGIESTLLGPRHSTTRCLEAGRPIKPVQAALIGGREPNDPDVRRRPILGDPLGPDDERSSWANDDSLLEASRPTSRFEPSCRGGLESIFSPSVEWRSHFGDWNQLMCCPGQTTPRCLYASRPTTLPEPPQIGALAPMAYWPACFAGGPLEPGNHRRREPTTTCRLEASRPPGSEVPWRVPGLRHY